MKKVEKISIGNMAFTLEEDAFLLLDSYIGRLEKYYEGKEGGDEIIKDIEERIAELITEACGDNTVVSSGVVEKIISTLGETEEMCDGNVSDADSGTIRKRLFRDPSNRMIGGVLSGISAYFGIDPSILRISVLVISILMFFVAGSVNSPFPIILLPALYVIFLICVPKARTVAQRCAMRGVSEDIRDIETQWERRTSSYYSHQPGHSELWLAIKRAFSLVAGIILSIMALSGLVAVSVFALGIDLFNDFYALDLLDYVEMGDVNPLFYKILLVLSAVLPLLAVLYLGVLLVFRLKGKYIGLSLFVLWLLCIGTLAFCSVRAFNDYSHVSRYSHEMSMNELPFADADTIYIDMVPYDGWKVRKMLSAGRSYYKFYCIDEAEDGFRFVLYPKIIVNRIDEGDEAFIEYDKYAVSEYSDSEAFYLAKSRNMLMEADSTGISLSPVVYSKENKFRNGADAIRLYVPENVEVRVRGAIDHDFRKYLINDDCDFLSGILGY